MSIASTHDWIVLELPDGIERSTIEALARVRGGELRDELPEHYQGQGIVVKDAAKHQLPSNASILTGTRLREEYFVGASLDERRVGLKTAMAKADYWWRWSGVVAVVESCPDHDLTVLIEEIEKAYAGFDEQERVLGFGWLLQAMNGDCRRANIARKLWIGDETEQTVSALRWLAEDGSRLPLLRWWDVAPKGALVASLKQAAQNRALETLSLRGDEAALKQILPSLGAQCKGIALEYGPADGSALALVLQSQAWDGMKRLNVYKSLGKSKGLEAVLASQKSVPLTHLNVGYNEIDKTQAERLLAWPMLDGIRHLELKYNDGRTNVAKAVATSPMFAKLELLDLSANEIGDPGLNAIAKSANWPNLHTLSLAGNHKKPLISEKGIANFVKNKSFSSLKTLDLHLNQLGDAGFALLMQAQHLPSLETLNVQFNGITVGAVEALAGKENVLRPKVLKLYSNKFGKGGYGVAPKPPSKSEYDGGPWRYAHWLSNVEELEFGSTDLETDVFADLCHSETLHAATSLDIGSNNAISNEAIAVLAKSPLATRLTRLLMVFCPISDGMTDILSNSPLARGLKWFSVARRHTSESELSRLRELFGARLGVT